MTSVDTWLVGHVGRAELAGVGLGGITAFMLLCFSLWWLQPVCACCDSSTPLVCGVGAE